MTVLLAILLALGVPFAQLHTFDDRITCCCPSPEVCKCPDHDSSTDSTMRACHKQGPQLQRGGHHGAFVAPPLVRLLAPVLATPALAPPISAPHAPPAPDRPDAPS